MVRVLLTEQLYRAVSTLHNHLITAKNTNSKRNIQTGSL